MSKTGQVLQSEIVGSVKMRVRLTGMPELRLGLNDKVLFENTGSKLNIQCLLLNLVECTCFNGCSSNKVSSLEWRVA